MLILWCAILASVVPVWARPQAPTVSSDQEVAVEQVCGGGWARSRFTYKSGEVINVDERQFATVQAAECAFDEATLLADQVFGHSSETALNGDMLSRAVFLIDGREALHIERRDHWLITRRSDSLDALRSFVRGPSRTAPPN
jgi:hypothetical protein